MKASSVYMKAAERVASGKNHFSCCAVARVKDAIRPQGPLVSEYAVLFSTGSGLFWGNGWDREDNLYDGNEAVATTDDGRNCRILALCFMAAIAEDEERSRKRRN